LTDSLNDHTHKQNEPWTTLGRVRDDLRQARAIADKIDLPIVRQLAAHINRALARIGDGSRSDG
jgi:hypothetical protein